MSPPKIGTKFRFIDGNAIYKGVVVEHTKTYGDFTVSWIQITDYHGNTSFKENILNGHFCNAIGKYMFFDETKPLEEYM